MAVLSQRCFVIATLGVYGSASTWVFNVLRELMIAQYGPEKVHAFFSESVPSVLQDPRSRDKHLVWKLHQADESWERFAALCQARIVLTIRDPRDAVLSMMQRFGVTFDLATLAIARAMARVAEAVPAGYPGLRYEDRFFDRPETVAALAQYIGVKLQPTELARIFDTYTTEHMSQFAASLNTLPPERIKSGPQTTYDDVTQIHRTHIGDQRVGKWREAFDGAQHKIVSERFAPYLRAFNYPT